MEYIMGICMVVTIIFMIGLGFMMAGYVRHNNPIASFLAAFGGISVAAILYQLMLVHVDESAVFLKVILDILSLAIFAIAFVIAMLHTKKK